jgi:hypothetical protein
VVSRGLGNGFEGGELSELAWGGVMGEGDWRVELKFSVNSCPLSLFFLSISRIFSPFHHLPADRFAAYEATPSLQDRYIDSKQAPSFFRSIPLLVVAVLVLVHEGRGMHLVTARRRAQRWIGQETTRKVFQVFGCLIFMKFVIFSLSTYVTVELLPSPSHTRFLCLM